MEMHLDTQGFLLRAFGETYGWPEGVDVRDGVHRLLRMKDDDPEAISKAICLLLGVILERIDLRNNLEVKALAIALKPNPEMIKALADEGEWAFTPDKPRGFSIEVYTREYFIIRGETASQLEPIWYQTLMRQNS